MDKVNSQDSFGEGGAETTTSQPIVPVAEHFAKKKNWQNDERSASPKRMDNFKEKHIRSGDNSKCAKVFVSNLDFTITWGMLKDFMKQAGEVVKADIFMKDGRSRGIG